MLTYSDNILHSKIVSLVARERQTLILILEHLQKVYDTRLFAKMGHSSLIKYLVKELGYSESAAYRRVQALKLTREIPETKKMVETGELSLSNINHLQNFMKDKKIESKKDAIQKIKGKTSKEAQDILFELVPEKREEKPATIKRVAQGQSRLSVNLSDTAMEKMEKLKARLKCYKTEELIERALDLALEATDFTKKSSRKSNGSKNVRVIGAKVKKEVLKRAQYRCEYPKCDEIHFLEWDHITPVAHGGTNEMENIRLLCKVHNQSEAMQRLGHRYKMKFLDKIKN